MSLPAAVAAIEAGEVEVLREHFGRDPDPSRARGARHTHGIRR